MTLPKGWIELRDLIERPVYLQVEQIVGVRHPASGEFSHKAQSVVQTDPCTFEVLETPEEIMALILEAQDRTDG